MAAGQVRTNSTANFAYGAIWHRILQEFTEQVPVHFPSAQSLKPAPYANFSLMSVNGAVLFPIRYAGDLKAGRDRIQLSKRSSETRLSILAGRVPNPAPALDLWPDEDPAWEPTNPLVSAELERARVAVRYAADNAPKVVVVAFASNPLALHRIVWGEVEVMPDYTLKFTSGGEDLLPATDQPQTAQRQKRVVGEGQATTTVALRGRRHQAPFQHGPAHLTGPAAAKHTGSRHRLIARTI